MDATAKATKRFYDTVWPQADAVLRYALMLTRSSAEAEDLAQETLIKAYRAIDQFKVGTNVRAWLMTILRRTHVDHVRASAARPHVSLDAMVTEPVVAEHVTSNDPSAWSDPDALLQQFGDVAIVEALKELPDDMRWTLLLVDVEGLDLKDAAEVLGVATGTVKSRSHRARAMLKTALEKRIEQSDEIRRAKAGQMS